MIKGWRFSAFNIALGFVALSLVALGLFAAPLMYSWHTTIQQGRAELLQAEAGKMTNVFAQEGPDGLADAIEHQVGDDLKKNENVVALLADPAMRKVAGNLPRWPAGITPSAEMQTLHLRIDERVHKIALLDRALPGGYHLLVGREVSRFERLENLFIAALAGAACIIVVVGIAGGLLVRRTLLAKVDDINQAACAIMQGNLSHRLPAHPGENELNTLVQTQNHMLDQIELLVDGIRNVSNAIAHDLRTPLAELRSRLEELVLTRPQPEQTFTEIDGALADVDRVIGIFNALLRMAEIDTGVRRAGFIEVDASTIAAEAAEFYQPVAELAGARLSFTSAGRLPLAGDPLLLAQAVGNLIDNAIKYAAENGAISVEAIRGADGTVEIAVADNGPGIPEEEMPKVFERFYRGDASRGTPGVGLGLSLVAAVAKLHSGVLRLADNRPGLRATLSFPPRSASAQMRCAEAAI